MSANSLPRLNYDPVYWRLAYSDGRHTDEPIAGGSIREAWKHPTDLIVVRWDGTPVVKVEIPRGACPIFYRRRSNQNGVTSLDATVFGWAREHGSIVDSKLWAVVGNTVQDCPQEYLAPKAIESLMVDYFHV